MNTLNLDGSWTVRKKADNDSIRATVPGCIHTDLLSAGRIDDPFIADNEKHLMWIGETDWTYERKFEIAPSFQNADAIELVCEGLDTLAEIKLNGKSVGKTDNAFRTWRFDVDRLVRKGVNTIQIAFASTIPYMIRAQRKRYLILTGVGHHRIDGSNQIRKSQCNYGWDWGPMCVTAGIWRAIRLEAVETARIADVSIRQDHLRKGSVALDIGCEVTQYVEKSLKARVSVSYDGTKVETTEFPILNGVGKGRIRIAQPELWWPNGLGEQNLYNISVELVDAAEQILDSAYRAIGLRVLTLERKPDKWGETFQFVVNGKPFFAKGANWIPADTFVTRVTDAQYRELVRSTAEANMNMLRVWGGGIYEDDQFYDLCDEYGICVWQDFMFACSAYPAYDEAYFENVEKEAEDNIRRLRHHPCIALWCGNNEIEQMQALLIGDGKGQMNWAEYSRLFDELLPGLLKRLDPDRKYWPSSPHTPGENRSDFNKPDSGDAHLWSVWHGREPFEWYRTCDHRFNSEFGFQSFPEPAVVAEYAPVDERNITSYIMELHQRSGIGNDAIMQYMLSWFRLPDSFDMTLWLSQILQGMAIKYAVEHWRRNMPRGMGTLYWQINDCWPVASWSSIDFYGNWKALHYMARDFYAPLLVSAVEHEDTGKVEIFLTNDFRTPQDGSVGWKLFHTNGTLVAGESIDCRVSPMRSTRVAQLDMSNHIADHGERNLILSLHLEQDGKTVGTNLVTFVRPKHLTLEKPSIATRVKSTRDDIRATLKTDVPALWCWPDIPGVTCSYDDRFFHLMPGESEIVDIRPVGSRWQKAKPGESMRDIGALAETLVVSSLRATYA